MDWSDVEGIAIALHEHDPDTDPLSVRFTDLRDRIMNLEGWLGGGVESFNEKKLEAVQMAWLEEFQDA